MDLDRDAWLETRRQGIGSSDAAAICGMSDFGTTPLHVYLDKLGLLPPKRGKQLDRGHLLEPSVASMYGVEMERDVAPPRDVVMIHPHHDWLRASIDRFSWPRGCREETEKRILELKTAGFPGEKWGPPGSDLVPTSYLIQVQHQMLVTGIQQTDIAVFFNIHDFRIYPIAYDPVFAQSLFQIEEAFWARVLSRNPPEPDWTHEETPRLLNLLHPPRKGLSIPLGCEEEMLAHEYKAINCDLDSLHERKREIQARLISLMGSAGEGLLPNGQRVMRNTYTRKGYTVAPCEVTDFRILPPKKEK